jgi:CHAD domain-containing protein
MPEERSRAEEAMHAARQALLARLARAAAGFRDGNSSDRSIHEIRRDLKRARATLRLLRACFGEAEYRRANSLLRDAARVLNPVRDAKVLFVALRSHDPHLGAPNPGTFMRRLYRVLGERRRAARRELKRTDLNRAGRTLRDLKRRTEALTERRLRQHSIDEPLKRAYKSARKAFVRARRHETDEDLHEWRKQAKYLSNELEAVLDLGPPRFRKSQRRAHKLAERLGDDHDLALLTQEVLRHAKGAHAPSRDDHVQEFIGYLARRRRTLQRKAFRLGERLFANRARRYTL